MHSAVDPACATHPSRPVSTCTPGRVQARPVGPRGKHALGGAGRSAGSHPPQRRARSTNPPLPCDPSGIVGRSSVVQCRWGLQVLVGVPSNKRGICKR